MVSKGNYKNLKDNYENGVTIKDGCIQQIDRSDVFSEFEGSSSYLGSYDSKEWSTSHDTYEKHEELPIHTPKLLNFSYFLNRVAESKIEHKVEQITKTLSQNVDLFP